MTNECPCLAFSILPPVITAEHNTKWCGVSLWSVGVSCPDCSLPTSCPLPPHFGEAEVVESKTGGGTEVCYQACVLSTLFESLTQGTEPHRLP